MRWPVLAAVLLALLAGCLRPLASHAEPDRPSVHIEPVLFDGKPLWLNATAHVSPLPPDVGAAATPGEPHNRLSVREDDDERDSYLGGVFVLAAWTAASSATEELNVTVTGPIQAPSSWSAQGRSPLTLVGVAGGEKPVLTPFTVQLAAAGGVPVPEQALDLRVMIGVLESDLQSLAWDPCGIAQVPV